MDESTRRQIAALKQTPTFPCDLVSIGDTGETARVKFLGRGELGFYQAGDRALLAEVLITPGVIVESSIGRWDTGEKVTEAEREAIIEGFTFALNRDGPRVVRVAMRAVDHKYLQSLKKQDPALDHRVAIGDAGEFARIRFGVRDGLTFYQEGDRALLLDARVDPPVIKTASIKRWDTGVKISQDERGGIVARVAAALRQAGAGEVTIV